MAEEVCNRCAGEITLDDFEGDTCPDCGRFVIGVCMECDEIMSYESEECPECGLSAPVSYRWWREEYESDIIAARKSGGPEKLANLLFKAWYDAGSLPDYDVMGDMDREMVVLYREHQMYDRLVFQMCYDATNYEGGSPKSADEAIDLVKEIRRADLELYCYEQFQQFNWTYYKKKAPEEITARIAEIEAMIDAGELERFDPELGPDMWVEE